MPHEIASYFVAGEPRPQGSKTPVRRGNKIILIEGTGKAPQLHKAWRSAVAQATREVVAQEGLEQIDYACALKLEFYLPRPKSRHKSIRAVTVKPDIDKLARSVLDGMTTSKTETDLLLKDDSFVVNIDCWKWYHRPDSEEPTGVQITVYDIRDIALFDDEEAPRLFND